MSSLDTISGLDSNRRLERLYMEDRVLPGIPNCGKVRKKRCDMMDRQKDTIQIPSETHKRAFII